MLVYFTDLCRYFTNIDNIHIWYHAWFASTWLLKIHGYLQEFKIQDIIRFWGHGEFGLGQKGHQLWIYMPLKTLFQLFDPLMKSCLMFWLFVLRPSTPLACPWLHHFKLLFRRSCNFMRFFVKTMENWWSKHLFLKSFLLPLNLCEPRISVRFYIDPHNPIPSHGVQYCPLIVM